MKMNANNINCRIINYSKYSNNNLLNYYNKLNDNLSDSAKITAYRDSNNKIKVVKNEETIFDKITNVIKGIW